MERNATADSDGAQARAARRLSADEPARRMAQTDRPATPAVRELTPHGIAEQRRLVRASLLIRAT